jgi:hypothetical protein
MSDGDGSNGGVINVWTIIKSVGTDVWHVTQCVPRLCEMRNTMPKLEDALRDAPSMVATRRILPHHLNKIPSIGLSYQAS